MTYPSASTPPADLEIDVDLIRGLLTRQHPDLANRPITPMESGWDNVMARLGDDLTLRPPATRSCGTTDPQRAALAPPSSPPDCRCPSLCPSA